jgi:hypothetical protein
LQWVPKVVVDTSPETVLVVSPLPHPTKRRLRARPKANLTGPCKRELCGVGEITG